MNWPMLPNDLWSLIGSKLDAAADRVRFRAVCKSMSSVLPFPQPIWLMLSQSQQHNEEGEGEEGPPRRGFVVVGEQLIYQLALPEAHDTRCVGSTGTWLITVDLYNNICMLNAFSRIPIHLPSQSTFQDFNRPTPRDERDSFLRKIVLSSSDFINENTNCIMAVAIYHRTNRLAFAMPGDSSWTKIDEEDDFFDDVIFFKDKLYLVTSYGAVVSYDFGDDPSRRSYEISWITDPCKPLEQDPCNCRPKKYYLVEWLNELLLVTRHIRYLHFVDKGENETAIYPTVQAAIYHTVQVEVHKLDFTNMNWVELNNLEEYSLFLGLNTSVSVQVAAYNGSLKRNCIYFTDDYTGACWMSYFERGLSRGYDMVKYDLDDRSLQPYYRRLYEYSCSPPIWIVPSLLSAVK